MQKHPFIPFSLPSIGEEEIEAVTATLRSGWITTGPKAREFEEEFSASVGSKHALAVNSCTSGLHLALVALGIGPGDEVITTPLTFCGTVHTILQAGATPVLADVGEDGNIDPERIAQRVTQRTRAVIPVHLGGLPCAMDAIWSLARRHNLYVVEDAAHAVGSQYHGSPLGGNHNGHQACSDAAVFSFYATKNITTGEGGMVTTGDGDLLNTMQVLALHGMSTGAWDRYSDRGSWYYEVVRRGFKYNLSDIQSAIGIVQLKKLEQFIALRTAYAHLYNAVFSDMAEVETPADRTDCRHSWHLYMLRLRLDKLEIDRAAFIHRLRQEGIGSSVHFIPISLHPFFATMAGCRHTHCPRAMQLYPRLVSLPLYPAMTEKQVQYVAATVKKIVLKSRRKKIFATAVGA